MNIEELTIKEAREIANMVNGLSGITNQSKASNPSIGKYCIVRCRNAGVHAGTVESMDNNILVLKDSRRMWYWKSAFTLSECATKGIESNSKIACVIDTVIIPVCDIGEVIPCSKNAEKSIKVAKEYHA